ncbi:hypothetical protein IDM40_15670 [Nocardiopsis sp. HNM0947]|uniref:SPW repeat-containing protein n=1 Tax=Nocardiopsis coralli TaxID=2772213 RepID=A0ABR9P8G0_9ACTN|nr:hypothetical protein [Nocardiopsis coralli]MBE3000132.1 hypothetical protein [Nocardiopsis coralli]
METIGPDPNSNPRPNSNPGSNQNPAPGPDPDPDPDSAASDLEAVANAERAVRDRPWPTWLYPANAVLLGALALAPLLPDPFSVGVWLALVFAVVFLNAWAGRRMGTPFAFPTSRGFLSAVAIATLFLVTAMLVAQSGGPIWIAVVCAAGTSASYGIGSIVHHRSTRR